MIVMVGRHWYALCEEILQQIEEEERRIGLRTRSMKRRMRTISVLSRKKTSLTGAGSSRRQRSESKNRRPPSHFSQRMPEFMQRFEKRAPSSRRERIAGWENRPKHFEIERNTGTSSREPYDEGHSTSTTFLPSSDPSSSSKKEKSNTSIKRQK